MDAAPESDEDASRGSSRITVRLFPTKDTPYNETQEHASKRVKAIMRGKRLIRLNVLFVDVARDESLEAAEKRARSSWRSSGELLYSVDPTETAEDCESPSDAESDGQDKDAAGRPAPIHPLERLPEGSSWDVTLDLRDQQKTRDQLETLPPIFQTFVSERKCVPRCQEIKSFIAKMSLCDAECVRITLRLISHA